jgi:hypothetical protein
VAGSCEHGSKLLGSVKGGEFFDYLNNCLLLKKESPSWRYLYHCSGIALGYGLDDRGSRVRFPAGAGNFSLHHGF